MLTQAIRKTEDPQFTFRTAVQVFAPTPPNSGAPISPVSALGSGNAYGNIEMYGPNTFEGVGQQAMNMGGGNPERQRGTAIRYSSSYGNPELEYVYLGSPKTPSPFLNPGFSFAPSNSSHTLQPTPGNAFVDQYPLVTAPLETGYLAPQNNFQSPLHPAQRFGGGVMDSKAQVQMQPPVAPHGLYDMPTDPEMQYDDIWANLEAVLLAQDAIQQYDVTPSDIGMVEAFGFEPNANLQAPVANQARSGVATTSGGNSGNSNLADYKSWAMPSQVLPERVEGSSGGQAIFSSNPTGKTFTRRDSPNGLPPRPAHHPTEVAQNSSQGFYPLGVAEFQGNTAMDMMDMVMEDGAVSDGVSSTENPSQHEVVHTQIPCGYTTSSSAASRDANGQRSSRPENNFRDPQTSQQMPDLQGGSGIASIESKFPGSMTMTNDFTQLMSPGLLGIGHLGESRWAVQLLNLCAAAIASQNVSRTQHLMWVLNDLASAQGDVNQRFAAYGLKALFCRITDNMEAAATCARPRHNEQEISFGSDRVHRALVRFHDHVPWHQNCYTASSQTLLEVCAGKSRLHLIDIGAGKGIEWPIFIDALASRTGGPPSILRITMIRDLRREEHNLRYAKSVNSEAADFMTRLVKFASVLGLHVEVNMVTKALECVTREDLRLRNGEILAVVTQFRLHRLMEEVPERPTNAPIPISRPPLSPRDEFIDFIFKLNPHIFILSENNSDHCPNDFLTRFHNVCAFWWNFYESMDLGYNGKDSEERQIIEFEAGTMMLNQVACEGIARIERNESYQHWSRRVRRAGFVAKDLSEDSKKACQTLVQNHSEFWDVNFDEPNMVSLRWRKEPTTFTSVWTTPGSACSKPSCKCSMLHN
ncbi:hypothetical protein M758_5G163200 [Ceratodon purpureus]|nr:hypothetical protein M758_5G163200 [Ceratodon purpureus]